MHKPFTRSIFRIMKFNLGQLVLAFAFGALVAGGAVITNVHADQPHMESALEHLRAARSQLQMAERDKGGHRTRAVEIVDHAIDEVKAGIAAGSR